MHPTISLLANSGILKRSSYYNPDYTQSAALIRARRPYLFKNALTGIGIASFAIGVFVFTLRAVGQEDFSDVVVPDEPSAEGAGKGVSGGGVASGASMGHGVAGGEKTATKS